MNRVGKQADKHFTPDFTSQVDFLGPCRGPPRRYVVIHTQMLTQAEPAPPPQGEPLSQRSPSGPNCLYSEAGLPTGVKWATAQGH